MNIPKKIIRYFLFGHILISCAAFLLCLHTFELFQVNLSRSYLTLVFFSTLSVYSLHAALRPADQGLRSAWIVKHRMFLWIQGILAACCSIWLLLREPGIISWMFLAGLAAVMYSLPRLLGNMTPLTRIILYWKTFYLALVWILVTTLIPMSYISTSLDTAVAMIVAGKFILILQVCLIFEQKDAQFSKNRKWNVWVNEWKPKTGNRFFHIMTVSTLALALMAGLSGMGSSAILSVVSPSLLLWILYLFATSERSDTFYFAWVDGVLLIPGILLYLF